LFSFLPSGGDATGIPLAALAHRLFVSFSQKEKGVGSIDTLSESKLPVAGLRRQAATGVENFYPQSLRLSQGICRLRRR